MKDFNKLSRRQKNILNYMDEYIRVHGYPPTIREIGNATDINSTSVVNYNLNKLVQAGYLERSDRVSRGMRLIAPIPGREQKKVVHLSSVALQVPLAGSIVAGDPLPAFENSDDFIEITPAMLGGTDTNDVFALRVNGESMIDAMIADGDIVILRKQQIANRGDMVAVWLDERGETTLKYYYPEADQVRLQPANPYLDPIYVPAEHCHIQGRVVSVLRQLR